MQITIRPQNLRGTVTVPSSKSYLHRYIILASLGNKPQRIYNPIYSDDIFLTIGALKEVGVDFRLNEESLVVIPPKKWSVPTKPLECGNSGSTLRLLLLVMLYKIERFSVHCDSRLITRLEETGLNKLPITYVKTNETLNFFGLKVTNELTLSDYFTSQYISSAMLLGTILPNGLKLQLDSFSSTLDPYIAMTQKAILDCGGTISYNEATKVFTILYSEFTYPHMMEIEGDYSLGSNFLVMGLFNERIIVKNLPKETLQADFAIVPYLLKMNANLAISANTITSNLSSLSPITIDLRYCPDLGPLLIGLACLIPGTTKFVNYIKLSYKECNRLTTSMNVLSSLGANITNDGTTLMVIGGRNLNGGIVDCKRDHRIAFMLAAISSRLLGTLTIKNSHSVSKSYPSFWDDFKKLGAEFVEEKDLDD